MANTNINFDDFVMRSQAQVFQRVNPAPLDKYSVFPSLAEAEAYAESNPVAYAGQLVAVVTESEVKVYVINDGKLNTIGGGAVQASTYSDAITAAKADNVGSIIYVSNEETVPGEGDAEDTVYTAGAYIVTGEGAVAKLGTTSASGDIAGDVEKLKGDVATAIADAASAQSAAETAQSAAETAQSAADANAEAIATLNGTGDGSVANTVDTKIAGLDLENTYASKDVVDTLVGDDEAMSVREIAVDEVAKIVDGAPEKFDTLKEVAEWIGADTTGAATMQTDIAAIKTAIGEEGTPAQGTEGEEGYVEAKPATGFYGKFATKDELTAAVQAAIAANNTTLGQSIQDAQDAADAAQADATAALEAIGDAESGLTKDVNDLKDATANVAEKTETSTGIITVGVTTENGGVKAVSAEATTATEADINALFEAPAEEETEPTE